LTGSDAAGFILGVGVPTASVGIVSSAARTGAWAAVETGVLALEGAAGLVSGGFLAAEGGLLLASFHEAKQVRVNYGCYLQ
jgi:hypothetical protein